MIGSNISAYIRIRYWIHKVDDIVDNTIVCLVVTIGKECTRCQVYPYLVSGGKMEKEIACFLIGCEVANLTHIDAMLFAVELEFGISFHKELTSRLSCINY